MKQPIKGKGKIKKKRKVEKKKSNPFKVRQHTQEYGTSQLERDFAREFLDKLGLKYVYQFEAKNIKRFYDFAVTVYDDYPYKYEIKDGLNSIIQEDRMFLIGFLIEVDGDYFHANPDLIDENKLNPMQKHNKFIDSIKNDWARQRGIPLLRIWENDIRNNSKKVMKTLKEAINAAEKRKLIVENRKKPH